MDPENFYHIYNRGNNKQNIFFNRGNYLYFLRKTRKYLLPHLDILAYCLMPNHFHFLAYTKPEMKKEDASNGLKIMLRSYTRAINKQEERVGSLFQQHTQIKNLSTHPMTQSHRMSTSTSYRTSTNNSRFDYPFICFHYIHQNPLKAGMVINMEEYEMSSYQDYSGFRNGSLCNQIVARELLGIPDNPQDFMKEALNVIVPESFL